MRPSEFFGMLEALRMKGRAAMLTTILIDVDNTLLDFNKCASQSMAAGLAELGIPYRPEMFPEFLRINDHLWYEIEQGRLTREGLHRIRWPWIFDKLSIDADGVAFEERFCALLYESHEPVDGALEALQYLSGKYRVYVASNAATSQQTHRLDLAGMLPYLKGLFISQEIGAPKPSREFFERCVERLGGPPKEEVLLLGDSLTADMRGGVDFGLKTCWYNHNGASHDIPLPVDYIIDRMEDVKKIL